MRTLGVTGASVDDEKYDAKGSVETSNKASESGCGTGSEVEDEGLPKFVLVEAAGFAVKMEGSNSRVLSNVRGMFSARRFYITRPHQQMR